MPKRSFPEKAVVVVEPTANWEKLSPLPPAFYRRAVERVAVDLLGKGLVVRDGDQWLAVELTEVEAYSKDDPASHSFRGPTQRCQPMFAGGGVCYVYLSYGVNYCVNVVVGAPGSGEAVLLRAGRPLAGLQRMRLNRRLAPGAKDEVHLLSGPGKLTQALKIGPQHNGLTFDRDDLKLVDLGNAISTHAVVRTPRIGISKAREALRRYHLRDTPWLSRRIPAAGSRGPRKA